MSVFVVIFLIALMLAIYVPIIRMMIQIGKDTKDD